MITIKAGVEFAAIKPAGARILEVLKQINLLMPRLPMTITSGTDGQHSGPADPHFSGEAYDLRTNTLSTLEKTFLLTCLQETLGARFFAFLENPGQPNEHIHCQRRRGTTYSIEDYLSNA